jgi:hypothetical protein
VKREVTRPPARNPCGSCPYRRDVPSGVWAEEEYERLPAYDRPTAEQSPSIFLCHQQDGRLCAGWTACHDMEGNLGLRMAVLAGHIDPEDLDEILDYTTTVPLFDSGADAAAHGMANIESPDDRARRVVKKLEARLAGR